MYTYLKATISIFFISLQILIAQNDLAIGQWRAHLPYQSGQYVTQSETQIFYATEWSLLSLDKIDFEVEFISTVNGPGNSNKGLSNTGIRLIKYHLPTNTLIVVYENSVIDLIQNESVTTLNQIKNFSNINGAKFIYDVVPIDDTSVYLASSFGATKLDLVNQEFSSTTFTEDLDIRAMAIFNGFLYAGTAEGIFKTPVENQIPEDFRTWTLLQEPDGFPLIYSTSRMAVYNNFLVFNIDRDLYRLDQSGDLEFLHSESDHSLQYLTTEGPDLIAGYRCIGCSNGKVLAFNSDFVFTEITACANQVLYGIQEPNANGRIFLADEFREFRFIDNPQSGNCTALTFSSPLNERLREIAVGNGQVWVMAGGVDQTFSNRFSISGFFKFEEGQWTNFNRNNAEVLWGQNGVRDNIDDLLDFITVAIHPSNGKVYLGSFYEGLVEFNGERFNLINETNSTLGSAIGDPLRVRVSGLAFDEDNNLWVANHAANNPLSVLTNDGAWQNFNLSCRRTEIHQIAIDDKGNKWIVDANSGAGLIVFNEGDLKDPNDDICRVVTQNNSELSTNNTNCIAADKDGIIWVGSTEGITIFNCGEDALTDCSGSRPIFQREGEAFGEFLLSREEVQTIAIDGANRKWIGTKNGVFVFSPDGSEELFNFTTSNSPLFDNDILDIAINPDNGEVFIGTNKGLISYQGDAIEGGFINSANIKVFPNPVEPMYDGPIAIKGLAQDANVKITTVTGKLVFETTALGGQAVWNARDYNGRRVNSGVYLIFSTQKINAFDTFRPDAAVAKVVVLNN